MDNYEPCTSKESSFAERNYIKRTKEEQKNKRRVQFVEEKQRIVERIDSFQTCLRNFLNSGALLYIFAIILYLVLPIYALVIGYSNLDKCNADSRIPSWLCFKSTILCSFGVFLYIHRFFKIDKVTQMAFILSTWSVIGLFLSFSSLNKIDFEDPFSSKYCNKEVYFTSFSVSIIGFIISISFILIKFFELTNEIATKKKNNIYRVLG
ncbi:unnamed protein product [Brachionus calyciflorus]|uniref:Uncharacterized protein n=1 Tax=Brachionus calyciflorus TaxID=104777 RepID=A0A814LKZ6_9BILA|nr:unnamed protein product [Brachionus calyciflorus]